MLMLRGALAAPVLRVALVCGLLVVAGGHAAAHASAHGGVYRGPGSTIGPGGATAGGPSTGGAGLKDTDVAAWDQWWSFNRDRYLALKDAIFDGTDTTTGSEDFFLGKGSERGNWGPGFKPTQKVLRGEVVPALRAALVRQLDVDIITGVLLALAKIGDPAGGPQELSLLFRGYLTDGNQEVHETAVIALGILGEPEVAPLLQDLMMNTSAGRAASGRSKVPTRTRAFAAYGLGLIGYRSEAQAVKRFVVHHLARAIEVGDQPTRDLIVAAILSMGIVHLDSIPPAAAGAQSDDPAVRVSSSREGQIEFLMGLWDDRRLDDRTRAHVPVAMARLALGAAPAARSRLMQRLTAAFSKRSTEAQVTQHGALLAAGVIGDNDLDAEDVALREALIGASTDADRLGRNLALLALARVAGREGAGPQGAVPSETRAFLLRRMARGGTAERPWAGLALGLLERGNVAAGRPPADGARAALHHAFGKAASPSERGALAIALGLVRHEPAVNDLIERTTNGDENTRGYAAVALGMMGARAATATLRGIVGNETYRPGMLREAAIALALLGDKSAAPLLTQRLADSKSMFVQIGLASALGFIGDGRSVSPVVQILQNKRMSETTRAFAAVALGMICDKERYPWNSKLAADVLWWQAPSTLHDTLGGKGILDLL